MYQLSVEFGHWANEDHGNAETIGYARWNQFARRIEKPKRTVSSN